ncbi:fibronectin type III domain-containing protein [Amycolatopsis sp. NPDC088138]|uniref:fibronectin type III domain-containing protein n=1 Tax=Amycolatopsis sp. NPDC088138 TaxID=3363938 RepID=UPI003815CF66
MALVAVGGVAVVTLALTGAVSPTPGLSFSPSGHWVVNPGLGLVLHVNGSSRGVDAKAAVPGLAPGDSVVQGDSSGYVVGPSQVTEFGKSDLAVTGSTPTPVVGERPVLLETDGGPYLVYRDAGSVVRLGPAMTVVPAGGKLGDPVAAKDGTVWVNRVDTGSVCDLPKAADQLVCPAAAPPGHAGALTLVGEKPVFVDTTADTFSVVGPSGLEPAVALGVDVPPGARVAGSDAQGRVAIFDPSASRLHLIDTAALTRDRPGVPPITVDVPPGDYATPAATGDTVALLDTHGRTLRTYGADGRGRAVTPIPAEPGDPRLSKGEDQRLYIDGDAGKHVVVVDPDGSAVDVPVVADPPKETPPVAPPPVTPVPPPSQGRPDPPRPPASTVPPKPTSNRPAPPSRTVPPVPPAPPPVVAAPATPPGVPGGLSATVSGSAAQVRWSAAAPNGAAVTAYHVNWSRTDGSGAGSLDTAGGGRSASIPGLVAGAAYRVQVAAQNSAGRGAAAATTFTRPAPKPSIKLSQGTRPQGADRNCGRDEETPDCAWMHVVLTGFAPNTSYHVQPHANNSGYSNPGVTESTDENGSMTLNAFYYYGVGNTVWVTVGSYTSARLVWRAS